MRQTRASVREVWAGLKAHGLPVGLILGGAALSALAVVVLSRSPVGKLVATTLRPLWSVETAAVAALLTGAAAILAGTTLITKSRPDLRGRRPLPGGDGLRWGALCAVLTVTFAALWTTLGNRVFADPLVFLAAIALALAVAYALYRLLLVRLARGPGPVAILEMTDATNGAEVPLAELTTVLRNHLADVDLYPQTLVPGASAPQDFVQQVQSASAGRNPVERAVRMLLAPLPSHAYRVQCAALQRDDASARFGVSVQVQLLPRWMSAPAIHWAPSWDEALQAGAYSVAETILPWTAQGKRQPWTAWLDEVMPRGLLAHYERGKRLAQDRRYDEALGEFLEALRLDPANLQLRMELAHVYQKLALWMDALEMYDDVNDLARRRLDDLHWSDGRRKTRALRASLKQIQIAAQYRRTISLAWGDLLAQQWLRGLPEAEEEGRDRDKRWARARLEQSLRSSLRAAMSESGGQPVALDPEWEPTFSRLIRDPRNSGFDPQDPSPEICLRLLFQVLAVHSARQHEKFHWVRRVVHPHALWITETSWDLIREWTEFRLSDAYWSAFYVRRQGKRSSHTSLSVIEESLCSTAEQMLSDRATSPEIAHHHAASSAVIADGPALVAQERRKAAERLQLRTAELVGVPRGGSNEQMAQRTARGRTWLDHYNAACTFVAPIVTSGWAPAVPPIRGYEKPETPHVQYAVEQLRAAMRKLAPSELVALAPWVCSEDPDLTPIRDHATFARFAAREFPGRVGEVQRPPDAHLMELALYTTQGGRRAARLIARVWSERLDSPPPDLEEFDMIWRQELRAWGSVADVANRYKHWQTRLRLTKEMDEWARRWGQQPLEWRYPYFDSTAKRTLDAWKSTAGCDALERAHRATATHRTVVRRWVECSDHRLQQVSSEVGPGKSLQDLLRLEDLRVSADARRRTIPSTDWKALAATHERLWALLAQWLSDDCVGHCNSNADTHAMCEHHAAFSARVGESLESLQGDKCSCPTEPMD